MKNFLHNKFYLLIAFFAGTVFLSNDTFLPAMDTIARDMGIYKGSVELAVTMFEAGALIFQLFMGPLSDKYGRKTTILACGLMFLVSNFYCGYTSSLTGLLIARIFSGSTMAVIGASGYSAINEFYEEKEAVKAMSYTANISLLAPLFGPAIGAYILKFTGNWRNIFYYDNILMLVVMLLILLYMPETNRDVLARKYQKNPKLYDKLSTEEQSELEKNPHKGESLLMKFRGMVMLSKNRTFMAYSMIGCIISFGWLIWITGSPVLLMNLGQTPEEYSLWQFPVFIGVMVGNNGAMYMAQRFGVGKTVNIITLIMPFCSILFMIGAWFYGSYPLGMVVPMTIYLLFSGLQNAPMNQFLLSMSKNFKGSAGALSGLFGGLGSVLGSFTASRMASATNFQTISVVAISVALVLFVGILARYWHRKDYERDRNMNP